ncbi:MAG: hypothetical protein ACFCU1_04645 [Sumerlaeia bacterium]
MPIIFSSKKLFQPILLAFCLLGEQSFAQQFEFDQSVYKARTGDVLPVEIRLTGVTEPLVAANFTIRVEQSSANLIGLDGVEGRTASLSSFTDFYQSTKVYLPTQTGLIEGEVLEFRGVVKATDANSPFELNEDSTIALLPLPIAFEGAGKVLIELVSVQDENGVPLCAAINSTGKYVANSSGRAPSGDRAIIIVNEENIPTAEDFAGRSVENRWVLDNSTGPAKGRFLANHGAQLIVSEAGEGAILRPRSELLGPWRPFQPETVVQVQWSLNRPKGSGNAPFRFGARLNPGAVSHSIFTSTKENETLHYWVQNNPSVQINPFFGILTPTNNEKSSLLVTSVDSISHRIPALNNRQLEYNQRFSLGNQAAWNFREAPEGLKLFAGDNGLTVEHTGQNSPTDLLSATWTVSPRRSNLKLNSGRLYQLEGTVYFNAESRRERLAVPQIVFSTEDYSFVHTIQLEAGKVSGEKISVSSWFQLPQSAMGKLARLEFHYLHPTASGAISNGSNQVQERVALESIKLTSYQLP